MAKFNTFKYFVKLSSFTCYRKNEQAKLYFFYKFVNITLWESERTN